MNTGSNIPPSLSIQFLFLIVVLLVSVTGLADQKPDLPDSCLINCDSIFGAELGRSPQGVKAYSNCSNRCVFPEPFFINKVFTGIQWQCVEYARRWLLSQRHVVYGDVDIAADIWDLDSVTDPNSNQSFQFLSVPNGSHNNTIQVGDLLIYDKTYLGTGHVAVVTQLSYNDGFIAVSEQNFDNRPWEDEYARRIAIAQDGDQLWLMDAYLIGWKRVMNEPYRSVRKDAQ